MNVIVTPSENDWDCFIHMDGDEPVHACCGYINGCMSTTQVCRPDQLHKVKNRTGISEVKSRPQLICSQPQQEDDSQTKGLNLGHFLILVLQKMIQ